MTVPESTEPVLFRDLGWLLSQTSHSLAVEQTARLEELGIAPRGFCVLTTALKAELTQGEIGDAIGVDKTTMVVTLDQLEKAGLAERVPSKTDRRARVIKVTAAGEQKVEQATEMTNDLYEEILGTLSEEQRTVLVETLNQLYSGPLAHNSPCQKPPRKRAPKT